MGYFDSFNQKAHDERRRKQKFSGALGSTAWETDEQHRKRNSKQGYKNRDEIKKLRGELEAVKKQKAKPAAKPKPKPKGDQQIEPVKHSPEITGAQKIANSYMDGLKDKKSPWAQAQNDVNSSGDFGSFNPGGKGSSTPDAQDFADKYKLDLISSGATKQNNTDFTAGNESSMSSADILKRDKQMYG